MIITKCEIETFSKYRSYDILAEEEVSGDYLRLSLPVPGGKVVYEISLLSGVKDNIEKAATLVDKTDKKK